MTNPYDDIPDFCFWSRAVTWPAPGQIDPVVKAAKILPGEKISTIGSCFAQHMSKHIADAGLGYYVPESAPPGMDPLIARKKGYGVFSARYGTVYTVRQAVQLFDRAYGFFAPIDDVWERGGHFVDAFRPSIELDGFRSAEEVRAEARTHLLRVQDVFANCDWLIFTLGLTECWTSKQDGAVYPLAPGVRGGNYDPAQHEFKNFTMEEIRVDLFSFIEKIRSVNAKVKVIITVSPVPLIATYENRHVLVSSTFSKSALRVSADEAERHFDSVYYFPSYEIVTSPAAGGRYCADDLREVNALGVNHVMRVFEKHFVSDASSRSVFVASGPTPPDGQVDIVCDEKWIEQARHVSGFACDTKVPGPASAN